MNGNSKQTGTKTEADNWVHLATEMVEKTEFGVVQLIIHNARVVRIERTEKVLLENSRPSASETKKLN